MRLSPDKAAFIKREILKCLPNADVYLFGSRADDTKRGGDIDILILGSRRLSSEEQHQIYWRFINKFGEQKLDLVSFEQDSTAAFKNVALLTAILL